MASPVPRQCRRLLAFSMAAAMILALSGCYYPYGIYAPGYYHYPAPVYDYAPRYYYGR